jgi:hypothetical protein
VQPFSRVPCSCLLHRTKGQRGGNWCPIFYSAGARRTRSDFIGDSTVAGNVCRQGAVPRGTASLRRLVPKPILHPVSSIEAELAEMDRAWRKYRSVNDRDAVYIYLASVFKVVMRWRLLDCAGKKSRAAFRLRPNPPQLRPEPFGIVIFCTADSEIVDAKTRSKWSRVLRYARKAKPAEQSLTEFIKSNGGINECARRFARNRRSVSDLK